MQHLMVFSHDFSLKTWIDEFNIINHDANERKIHILRTSYIYYVRMNSFLSGLEGVSYLPSDVLRKDSMGALQGTVKTHMPTITKQALRYELGVSRI
jgi:hypothetical protein